MSLHTNTTVIGTTDAHGSVLGVLSIEPFLGGGRVRQEGSINPPPPPEVKGKTLNCVVMTMRL